MSTKMLERGQVETPPETEAKGAATPAPGTEAFTPQELASFQSEDWHAAAAISSIMVTILAAGLIAYIFIACWVLAYPN